MPPARFAAAAGMAALSLALCGSVAAQKTAPRAAPPPPRVEGTVRDAAGKPIEKALVLARTRSGDRFEPTTTARTDASGRFSLALPRAGELLRAHRGAGARAAHDRASLGALVAAGRDAAQGRGAGGRGARRAGQAGGRRARGRAGRGPDRHADGGARRRPRADQGGRQGHVPPGGPGGHRAHRDGQRARTRRCAPRRRRARRPAGAVPDAGSQPQRHGARARPPAAGGRGRAHRARPVRRGWGDDLDRARRRSGCLPGLRPGAGRLARHRVPRGLRAHGDAGDAGLPMRPCASTWRSDRPPAYADGWWTPSSGRCAARWCCRSWTA